VHEFVRRGKFESNLVRVRELVGARRDAMLEALDEEFPESVRWSRPNGGYFLWLDLPEGIDARELLAPAGEGGGVTFVAGTDFGDAPNTARLAYSFVSPDEIREGVRRLAALLTPVAV